MAKNEKTALYEEKACNLRQVCYNDKHYSPVPISGTEGILADGTAHENYN